MNAYRESRALVLGATGFIGRRVVRALLRAGARVVASSRGGSALEMLKMDAPDIDTAVCDVCDAAAVDSLVRFTRPDIVFNLAGYGVDRSETDEVIAREINSEVPRRLADLLGRPNVRTWRGQVLVHAGSALEYGEADGDLHENTRPVATTVYGSSKLAGTEAITAAVERGSLKGVTARLFTVYGPGERSGRLLPALIETARTGRPLPLTAGTQLRDFTYVDDVAEGLLRLGTSPAASPIVNMATGRLESVRRFAERAAGVLGIPPALLCFGELATRSEEMAHAPVSIARLQELTAWKPTTTIEDGVMKTLLEKTGVPADA